MSTSSQATFRTGELFDGRFEIVGLLGRGNFSEVYQARQTVYGAHLRDVALKVFKEGAVDESSVYDVFNDAITLARLMEECPDRAVDRHIVRILDGGVAKDHNRRAFLTMELIRGGPLNAAIRQHKGLPGVAGITVELALFYLRQILIPLAWMHSMEPPAIHGDLHPGNLLVTEKGELKVVDFGLAARLPAPVFGGALDYQAPETLLGQSGDTRFDVFALGIIWYEMLTGHSPFRSDRLEMLGLELHSLSLEATATEDSPDRDDRERAVREKRQEYIRELIDLRKRAVQPASEENTQLRDHLGLENILNRCLAYWPKDRIYSAAEMQKQITQYLGGRPMTLPAEPESGSDAARAILPSRTPESTLEQALILASRGAFEQALGLAEGVVRENPKLHQGWIVNAKIMLLAAARPGTQRKKECLERAAKYAQEAQNLAREDPRVIDILADVYEARGMPEIARRLKSDAAALRNKIARRNVR